MKRIIFYFLAVGWMQLFFLQLAAQKDTTWTEKKALTWFNTGSWKNGLKLTPSPSINILEFARQYHANQKAWDKTFAFLRDKNLTELPTGNYKIDGNDAYADVTDNPSTPFEDAKWHSHKKLCDIQMVILGKERVGVAPVAGLDVVEPFNDKEGDAQFYNQQTKGTYYTMEPGTFYLFFPTDAHRPFIKINGGDKVKRIRLKVKAREI